MVNRPNFKVEGPRVQSNPEYRKRYHKWWRERNPERVKAHQKKYRDQPRVKIKQKRWREANKEYIRELTRAWRQKNKARIKAQMLFARYGITPEAKERLLKMQKNRCAICKEKFRNPKTMHVDHCHITRRVRGLLCHYCNFMLGSARDSTKHLRAAIRYLTNYAQEPG